MVLRFSSGDEDAFRRAKDELLRELGERLGPDTVPGLIADVEMFLNWTVTYSDGRLDRYRIEDISEYLLGWCPAKVVVPEEELLSIVNGVRTWIEHLVTTRRWAGEPAQELLESLDALVPQFIEVMEDESMFGMGKSIVMDSPGGGPDVEFGDQSAMEALIEAFNDLSPEQRMEITEGTLDFDDPFDPSPTTDLPITDAPDQERAEQQAALTPLVGQLDAVREYLGRGVKLTATGNPKLVDAKAMMELLVTDDRWERMMGDQARTLRSANELPHMMFLLRVASAAGALDDDGKTLAPSTSWDDVDPLDRCTRLLDAVLEIGVVSRGTEFRYGRGRANLFDDVNEILDDGGLHLLIPAFIAGEEYSQLVIEQAIGVVRSQLEDVWPQFFTGDVVDDMIERDVNRAFETFERLGMVELRDRVDRHERYGGGTYRTGGSVRITDLGRYLIEEKAADLGYAVHHAVDLATSDAVGAVVTLATSEVDPATIWRNWAPAVDPVDKFDELMDVLAMASTGPERLAAVALLEQAPEQVRRRVEAMVDGPRAAYALMVLDPERSPFAGGVVPGESPAPGAASAQDQFGADAPGSALLSDGRSVGFAIQELGPARSLAPLVDLLWLEMDVDPADLIEHVILLDAGSPETGLGAGAFTELLEDIWRVDLPETVELLEFLGANHPVRATAKLARKGVVRHRSAYPGRH